jgi:glutamyl-tRNA synthetase
MLLRIEDTDVERSRQHHAEQIVSSLEWLGIQWDEGPVFQSDRLDRYRERASELVSRGLAYRCYCSIEDLDADRAAAEKVGKQYRYSGKCRIAAEAGLQGGIGAHVIRFKVPEGPILFQDLIRGDVQFEAAQIDDFVLLRSDGYPTYHLSVVVDDVDMDITIVARGDDHLSNTPKHILLFRAFGAEVPDFAHLPLILGPDRKRLSKRTGAASAEEYRDMGVLPEALFNFLTLLGWAPGGDRELLTREESTSLFDLSDVNKAPAVFDQEKLIWMNGQYLQKMSVEEIYPNLIPFLHEHDRDQIVRLLPLVQTRARTLREMAEQLGPYLAEDARVEYEEEAVRKHVRGADIGERMHDLLAVLSATEPFDVASTEHALRELAESHGLGAGKYIHPLRVALTGKSSSPPIFDVAVALGKDSTLRRLERLIEQLPALTRE